MSRMSRFHERKEALRKSLKENKFHADPLQEGLRKCEEFHPQNYPMCKKLVESIKADSRLAERYRKAGNGRMKERALLKVAHSYMQLSDLYQSFFARHISANFLAEAGKNFHAAGGSEKGADCYFSAANVFAAADMPKRGAELFLLAGRIYLRLDGLQFNAKNTFTEAAGLANELDYIEANAIAVRALKILGKEQRLADETSRGYAAVRIGEIAEQFEPFTRVYDEKMAALKAKGFESDRQFFARCGVKAN